MAIFEQMQGDGGTETDTQQLKVVRRKRKAVAWLLPARRQDGSMFDRLFKFMRSEMHASVPPQRHAGTGLTRCDISFPDVVVLPSPEGGFLSTCRHRLSKKCSCTDPDSATCESQVGEESNGDIAMVVCMGDGHLAVMTRLLLGLNVQMARFTKLGFLVLPLALCLVFMVWLWILREQATEDSSTSAGTLEHVRSHFVHRSNCPTSGSARSTTCVLRFCRLEEGVPKFCRSTKAPPRSYQQFWTCRHYGDATTSSRPIDCHDVLCCILVYGSMLPCCD